MSISQEQLPSTGQVRNKFRELEDSAFAQRLQEQEFDQYYNSNVQVRRTAQQDFNVASKVAKKLQAEETEYAKELRRRELEDQNVAAMLSSEELRREEELKKQESQDIEAATLMQDEEIAWKIQQREDAKLAKVRQMKEEQERRDAELARIASLDEETEQLSLQERRKQEEEASLKMIYQMQAKEEQKKKEEEELSLKEIQRLQELHKQREREEEMSKKAILEMKKENTRGSTSSDRPPPPSYDELQLQQDKGVPMRRDQPYVDQEFGRPMSKVATSPTKIGGRNLPADMFDGYPRAVATQSRPRPSVDPHEPIAGTDIMYGGPQYSNGRGLVDPPPPADAKGRKKSKEKKQKKK